MRAVSVGLSFLVLSAAMLETGCGSSDPASSDAAGSAADAMAVVDATPIDAGPADAFNPCPGAATFEVGVVDWVTGENLPGVVAEESKGNAASSAPNGRVVVCVPASGPVNIRFTKAEYVNRVHTTSVEAIAAQYATGVAPSFRMLKVTDADSLYSGAMLSRDGAKTTVIAMPTNTNTGLPLAGATVSIVATNEGAFIPQGASLTPGLATAEDGKLLFLNTDLGSGTSEVSVTGPGSCEIPASVILEAGVSSVSMACQP